jgi:hypothetical protein
LFCSTLQYAILDGLVCSGPPAKLDALGFAWEMPGAAVSKQISKGNRDAGWEGWLVKLKAYTREHGDCNVPQGWAEEPGLGSWVATQRRGKKKLDRGEPSSLGMTAARAAKLQALGFAWELSATAISKQHSKGQRDDAGWDAQLAKLKDYAREHGDCSVPQKWAEDPSLGTWVADQRANKKKLDRGDSKPKITAARVAKLDELGFNWAPRRGFAPRVAAPVLLLPTQPLLLARAPRLLISSENSFAYPVIANAPAFSYTENNAPRRCSKTTGDPGRGYGSSAHNSVDALSLEQHQEKLLQHSEDGTLTTSEVQAALQAGADLDATDGEGWSPLLNASINGHLAVVKALLEAGAETALEVDGSDARGHALAAGGWGSTGYEDIVAAIDRAGESSGSSRREQYERATAQEAAAAVTRCSNRRELPISGTDSEESEPWVEADGQPRPAKRAHAAVQRGESAPAYAWGRGEGRGLTRDDTGWEAQLAKLRQYRHKHGDCNVPRGWADAPGLGIWVNTQRQGKKKLDRGEPSKGMTSARAAELEALGFAWELSAAAISKQLSEGCRDDTGWEAQRAKLMKYRRKHGDCNVPWNWAEEPGLGSWVNTQRRGKKKLDRGEPSLGMTAARAAKLEALGFAWKLSAAAISKQRSDGSRDDAGWEVQLVKLEAYKRKRGDCSVPVHWAEDPSLGRWVNNQRVRKKKLDRGEPSLGITAARVAKLDALGFAWALTAVRKQISEGSDQRPCRGTGPHGHTAGDIALLVDAQRLVGLDGDAVEGQQRPREDHVARGS